MSNDDARRESLSAEDKVHLDNALATLQRAEDIARDAAAKMHPGDVERVEGALKQLQEISGAASHIK